MYEFTAKIFDGNQEIERRTGNDSDILYIWMLTQVQGKFGDLKGIIIDNSSSEIIKTFNACSSD